MGDKDRTVQCPQCHSHITDDSQFCNRCGHFIVDKADTLTYTPPLEKILDDHLGFSPGDKFGPRYRIIEEIGRGGMGSVYKAEDQELNITVALKMIRSAYSSSPRFIQRFKEETLLARSISHENVIRIHDLGDVDDIKFISMDYIKGHDLKELIHTSGTLSIQTAISITRQICGGLKAAHQKNIIHLDLKPRNIMLDSEGKVYIMDFGVARTLGAHEAVQEKKVIGTPAYISPEQAKGEEVDKRSDIYSLGIILFEMLVGKRPFEADTLDDFVDMHIHKKPPRPLEIRPQIPPFLDDIVLRCLKKDKNKRYQNVEELLEDLEAHEEESHTFIPQIKTKNVWKYLYLVPVVLLAVLAIYLLVVQKEPTVSFAPEGGKIPLFVMLFNNNSGDENFDNWKRALSDGIIQSLLPSQIIRVRTGDTRFSILSSLNLLDAKEYSSQDFMKVATRGEITHILYGNYTKADDTFIIQAILKNVVTGENIASEPVKGKGETTFLAAIDQLSRWVISQFKTGTEIITADSIQDIEDSHTSSPEALKLYTLGKQYYREGKLEECNEVLLEAVEIDPGFALAHKRISENYHYLGDFDQAMSYAQKALNLVEKKSIQAQYLVRGWAYTILEESYEKAIAMYNKLLESHPDDEEGNIYLGAIYRNMEEWDLAFERFNHILEVSPSIITKQNSISVENIVLCYQAKGMYREAVDFIRKHKQSFSNQVIYHSCLAFSFICQRKFSLALAELKEALALDPEDYTNIEIIGHLYHTQDDFPTAESYYLQLLDSANPSTQLWGRYWLANLCLARGQYKKSAEHILIGLEESEKNDLKMERLYFLQLQSYLSLQMGDFENGFQATVKTDEIASEIVIKRANISASHLRGLILLKLNKTDEAKVTAKKLISQVEDSKVKNLIRYYHHLNGMIAESEGLISQAIENFELALSFLPFQHELVDEHALYFYPLALAYYQNGQINRAQEQLNKLIDLTAGRLHCGDLYAKSYYWLGKVYQTKGQKQEALIHYQTFLKLWINADSDVPEVGDARKQQSLLMEGLKE